MIKNKPKTVFKLHGQDETVSFYVDKGEGTVSIFTNRENTGTSGQTTRPISEARDIWTKYNNMGYTTK